MRGDSVGFNQPSLVETGFHMTVIIPQTIYYFADYI